MSQRITLGQFKTRFSWTQVVNMAPSDPRWLMLCNEALERLLNMGLWVGSYQRYQICTSNGQLTWPRQFDTIEVIDICGQPTTIRNQWFEFLDQGPGLWKGGCGVRPGLCCSTYNYLDRGRGFVMFDDPRVYCKLRFYPQFASDVGKVINIRGYDENRQEVLTDDGATVGENVTLALPWVDTVTTWMPQVFREIIKPKTNGYVRCYSYPSTGDQEDLTALAVWEPTETIPNYRRCVIPSLANQQGSCCNGLVPTTCKPTVTVMAKLAFIPLESDLDIIPLTCAPAIKMAMLSIMKQERGDTEGAHAAMWGVFNPVTRQFEDGAIPLLEAELAVYQGSGSVAPLRIERNLDTANILNLI